MFVFTIPKEEVKWSSMAIHTPPSFYKLKKIIKRERTETLARKIKIITSLCFVRCAKMKGIILAIVTKRSLKNR